MRHLVDTVRDHLEGRYSYRISIERYKSRLELYQDECRVTHYGCTKDRERPADLLNRPLVDWTVSHKGPGATKWPHIPCFDAQSSEILGYGDHTYPLSLDLMGSIPKISRRHHTYSWQRKAFHGLRKLRTTVIRHFLRRKKAVEEAPGGGLLLDLGYARETQAQFTQRRKAR